MSHHVSLMSSLFEALDVSFSIERGLLCGMGGGREEKGCRFWSCVRLWTTTCSTTNGRPAKAFSEPRNTATTVRLLLMNALGLNLQRIRACYIRLLAALNSYSSADCPAHPSVLRHFAAPLLFSVHPATSTGHAHARTHADRTCGTRATQSTVAPAADIPPQPTSVQASKLPRETHQASCNIMDF